MSTKENIKILTTDYGTAYAALTKDGLRQLTVRWDLEDDVNPTTHVALKLVEGEVHTILPKAWYQSIYIPAHNIGRQYETN